MWSLVRRSYTRSVRNGVVDTLLISLARPQPSPKQTRVPCVHRQTVAVNAREASIAAHREAVKEHHVFFVRVGATLNSEVSRQDTKVEKSTRN